MWIFEAISEVPFKKLFVVLTLTLGAAFLLLASVFHVNPLYDPLLYAATAAALLLVQNTQHSVRRLAILLPLAFFSAFFLLPEYRFFFSLIYMLILGQIIFRESFRIWKWIAASILLYISILIVSVWQQIYFLNELFPFQTSPAFHSLILSFCMQCSLLLYFLQKDRVYATFDGLNWRFPSEAAEVALHTRELYTQLKKEFSDSRVESKHLGEFKDFAEATLLLCYKLHQMGSEIAAVNPESLDTQVEELNERIARTSDTAAQNQYRLALKNKETQKQHFENLKLQEERTKARVYHYVSALENMKFAYSQQYLSSMQARTPSEDFFLEMARIRAESAYETTAAYQKLAE